MIVSSLPHSGCEIQPLSEHRVVAGPPRVEILFRPAFRVIALIPANFEFGAELLLKIYTVAHRLTTYINMVFLCVLERVKLGVPAPAKGGGSEKN